MSTDQLLPQLDQQRRRVDFDTYDIIVQQLIHMVTTGSIDVAPAYQRQFRWDGLKRSQLIESVFLGVPIPNLFMASNRDGTWELVDGVQRLSSIIQFAGTSEARKRLNLDAPLELEGLEKLTNFNDLAFEKLPESLKLHFLNRPIKVITLSDKSDPVVRFDLFERLNTGGVALTNQEIRACIFRGPFNDFLERIAKNKDFFKVVRLTERQERDGTREECALRFFAFLHGYRSFVHSVVGFLNDFMREATKEFDYAEGERLFSKTFAQLARIMPKGIVRTTGRSTTPLNLYEAVAVGAALAVQKGGRLSAQNLSAWMKSGELKKLTTGATNNRAVVAGRIEFCRDRFLGK